MHPVMTHQTQCLWCKRDIADNEPGAHHAANCRLYRSPFVGPDAEYWDKRLYERWRVIIRSPRTGETPEQILDRLAKELGCEPRQVCDRVIAMLEERKRGR